jgi:DNA polymerase (family X)
MGVGNRDVALLFERHATLLAIEGANPFRVRAYEQAARTIRDLPESLADMVARGDDLAKLPAIGKDLAGKIGRIVETGRFLELEQLEEGTPGGLAELTELPGLGPKRVRKLHEALGIAGLADLQAAVEAGEVRDLEGFGARTEERIRHEIARRQAWGRRTRLIEAEEQAEPLIEHLRGARGLKRLEVAGSYRRRRDTVGDLDIVATCRRGSPVMDHLVAYGEVLEVVSKGGTRATVILRSGLQVDLRVVPEVSFGAALHYLTGSKAHNIAIRRRAVARGLKVNEYGVFRGERRRAGRSEAEVYEAVGLPWITPELREGTGEIEAAEKGRLPRLVTLEDIRGDLHMHTTASDGRGTLEDMARAARERGLDYIAITDHSRSVRIANGLDARRLAGQIEAIDRLNERLDGIRVLRSCEVDILEDGSLDLPDDILARLDLRVCSVHSAFGLSREKQTERILRAMDNRLLDILAHPTGRLIGRRDPYEVDIERVLVAARERGCFLEVNAQPDRLDLDDRHCRLAKEIGVKLAISTDAHSAAGLGLMRCGVDQARRGWLEADDVLNTRPVEGLLGLLRRD